MSTSGEDIHDRLSRNIRQLRDARGLTQVRAAQLCGLPRATWAHLESGSANPTLQVLHKVALALQVSIEELLGRQRAEVRHYPAAQVPVRRRGSAQVRKLLPDPIPGMEIDRIELPPRGHLVGVPHTPGTREYLTCEAGEMVLAAAGEQWQLAPGDVVVFRGDQRHSYHNPGGKAAVGYSVVILAPAV